MRKSVVAVVALLAATGIVAAGYVGAKRYGESRLRDTMNTLVAGSTNVANLEYGAIAFDPLARRATIDDVVIAWQDSDLKISHTILNDIDFGKVDPQHARIEFRDVTDRGFFNALLLGIIHSAGPRSEVHYDLVLSYDFDAPSRSLVLHNFAWSAPEWGDLAMKLDVTQLPDPLPLPELGKTTLHLPDLGFALIRGAVLSYRDHGGVSRIIDRMAASTGVGDPRTTFLDLRDALKAKLAAGQAAPWDQALLELMLGKADIDASVTPQSPVRLARLMRLPEDAGATSAALGLKIATAGQRHLGQFAISEKEERALRAQPFIATGEAKIALPDLADKFAALSAFQQAAKIAPDEPHASEGVAQSIAALIEEGQKREQALAFYGKDGAIELYREIIRCAPESAEAKVALAAVPKHLAEAALATAEALDHVQTAYAFLRMAVWLNADDPTIPVASSRVAERLVARGDQLASEGALVDEPGGALSYYIDSLALSPGNAAALQALDALAERLKQSIAQQIFAGDKAGATERIETVKAQWPDLPGREAFVRDLAALLTPPMSHDVSVYNWSDYIGEFTNHRFEEKTGINVEYRTFDSNADLEARLMSGNSDYDVVVPSGGFLGRQIPAGVFQKLDKSRLPNLVNLDPTLMKVSEAFDPGHEYSVPYFWGTVGIGYNVEAIKKRMPNAPLDSWRLILDPKVVAKFKDCGVTMLDAPSDVLLSVLTYLGRDPNTEKPEDYEAARKVLSAVRPYIKYFHSSAYINDIANGEVCLAIGWNGDFMIAQSRAKEARNGVKLRYVIPKEGTLIWMDNLAIPADAPHPDAALAYIDYLLEAQTAADNANYVGYASPNHAALDQDLINARDRNDPAIYPPPSVMERLRSDKVAPPEVDQLRTRIWQAFKTGQ